LLCEKLCALQYRSQSAVNVEIDKQGMSRFSLNNAWSISDSELSMRELSADINLLEIMEEDTQREYIIRKDVSHRAKRR
jgi:hypothetical protein